MEKIVRLLADMPPLDLAVLLAGLLVCFVAFLRWPYIGLGLLMASLPVTEVLPEVPGMTSAVSALGALVFVAFVIHRLAQRPRADVRLEAIHIFGLLFIVWFLLTNPDAALRDDDRNWAMTFVQLWILLWMTGESLRRPDRQHFVMYAFSIACVVCGAYTIMEGGIGHSVQASARSAGLAAQANATARMLTAGTVFLIYLLSTTKKTALRLFCMLSILVLVAAVVFTVSRTGFFLLAVAGAILLYGQSEMAGRERWIIPLAAVALFFVAVPDSYWNFITSSVTSVQEGGDTMGQRYGLWKSGVKMALDHPIAGVGIGQFDNNSRYYGFGLLKKYQLTLNPHNSYIAALTETGIVGFILFVGMLVLAWIRLFRSARYGPERDTRRLAHTWFTVFIVLLIGGMTKADHYNKMLWMTVGVATTFAVVQPNRVQSLAARYREESARRYDRAIAAD